MHRESGKSTNVHVLAGAVMGAASEPPLELLVVLAEELVDPPAP
jgi:hypothetical protein